MDTKTVVWPPAGKTIMDLVQAGAELLDRAYADREESWYHQVDLERLDMSSPTDCVVAQTVGRYDPAQPCWCSDSGCPDSTTGSFGEGMIILGLLSFGDSYDHGFSIPPFAMGRGNLEGELRDTWRELILARRAAVEAEIAEHVAAIKADHPEYEASLREASLRGDPIPDVDD